MNKILIFRRNNLSKQRISIKAFLVPVLMTIVVGLSLAFYLPNELSGHRETVQSINILGDIKGMATVTDGDSIRINGIRIRLHGIDAPEINQPCWKGNVQYQCGKVAKKYLSYLINNQLVKCQILGLDQYGRKIAKCYNHKNLDIESMMVSSGMAMAYLYYSQDYVKQQEVAKKEKLGIWAGRFTEPYLYRKNNRS